MSYESRRPILERWLGQQWLFAAVQREQLAPLAAAMRAVHYGPGEMLYRAGDAADGLYFLTGGTVRVAALDAHDQPVGRIVTAPALLGEVSVLDGQVRTGAVQSVGSSTAYFLPAEPFQALLWRSPAVSLRLLALLAQRLRQTAGGRAELPATAAWQQGQLPGPREPGDSRQVPTGS